MKAEGSTTGAGGMGATSPPPTGAPPASQPQAGAAMPQPGAAAAQAGAPQARAAQPQPLPQPLPQPIVQPPQHFFWQQPKMLSRMQQRLLQQRALLLQQ